MAKVLQLFYTLDNTEKTRVSTEKIDLDNDGVLADKFHGKNLQRSVLITSVQSYEIAKKESVEIDYGALGENILVDINPYHLVAGEQLSIGNVTLEITQNCTLCKGLSTVSPKLPKLLKDDRGIFAKVISGKGTISVGDSVTLPR